MGIGFIPITLKAIKLVLDKLFIVKLKKNSPISGEVLM